MTPTTQAGDTSASDPVTILYTNWRGETAVRRIIIPVIIGSDWMSMALRFKSNEWHPEPQWLLAAYDVEKEAGRDFALFGIKAWGQNAVDAALAQPTTQAGSTSADETVERISLADCPIGLFLASNGALCLKSEYGDNEGRIDAYIVESGEFFWGGANSIGEQRRVMVTPVPLEQIADAIRLPFASRSPSPAVVPESVRRESQWLEARIEAAHKDSEAHPEGSGNRAFYLGQAIAYENALSLIADAPPSGRAAEGGESAEDESDDCGICDKPMIAGQRVMQDVELGTVHAACCGPEREAYVKDVETGEPLGPNDPIPQGYVYEPERAVAQDVRTILARLWCQAEGNDPDDTISDAGHTILDGTLGGLDKKAFVAIVEAERAILKGTTPPGSPRYQYREIGEGEGWRDCSREAYEGFARDPHIDTREIDPTPPDSPMPWDEISPEGKAAINAVAKAALAQFAPTPPASAGDVETERFDARVNAALAAWTEAQRTATVDEHQADTDYGAMMCAVAAADALAEKGSPWTISSENVEALIREFEETHHDRPAGGSATSKLAKRIVDLATAPAAPEPAAGGDGWQDISTVPLGVEVIVRGGKTVFGDGQRGSSVTVIDELADLYRPDGSLLPRSPKMWHPVPPPPSTPTGADAGAEWRR